VLLVLLQLHWLQVWALQGLVLLLVMLLVLLLCAGVLASSAHALLDMLGSLFFTPPSPERFGHQQ
jgi:hypothetical protein